MMFGSFHGSHKNDVGDGYPASARFPLTTGTEKLELPSAFTLRRLKFVSWA